MRKTCSFAVPILKFSFVVTLVFSQALILPRAAEAQQLSIRGSDTLIYLGQRFASIYSRSAPDAHINVQGGGWHAAMNAVSSGDADIGQIENEVPGTLPADLVSFPIGVQTIVVYVNQSNPVHELTIGQLRSIFMGEITNWKALGGPDTRIMLYAGESTTGTLAYFQESVLKGQEPYPFEGKANTKALLEEIAAKPEAIGYGSPSSGPGTRALAIKFGPASLAIEPTEEAIRARKYPITRHISWAARRKHDAGVDAFCRWILSSEGQLVVEASGFEPLLPSERQSALARLGTVVRIAPASFSVGRH